MLLFKVPFAKLIAQHSTARRLQVHDVVRSAAKRHTAFLVAARAPIKATGPTQASGASGSGAGKRTRKAEDEGD